MKIHEYQAKELFAQVGIAVQQGKLTVTPDEAQVAMEQLGGRCAIKAQVHIGGRGKAGGVKLAETPEEGRQLAQQILGLDIKGYVVQKVWVEQAANIAREAYLSLLIDRAEKCFVFVGSAAGGVDIEEVAATTPEKILKVYAKKANFPRTDAASLAGALFGEEHTAAVQEVMEKVFKLFLQTDASLIEINPLVLTAEGIVIALDGKVNFDDNGLGKHPELLDLRDMEQENANELEAKEKGLSFVELDGNIGCMVNGAGLAMCTMDMIKLAGGEPANFLDVGGSSSPEKVVNAFDLILRNKSVKAILINIFGGITRCDDIARGIIESFKRITIEVPVVVRLVGTNEKEGLALLEGVEGLIPAASLGEGVQKVVQLSK